MSLKLTQDVSIQRDPSAVIDAMTKIVNYLDLFLQKKHWRKSSIFLVQLLTFILAYYFAYVVRFDQLFPSEHLSGALVHLPALLLIKLAVSWRMGLFGGWWSFVSLHDLWKIARAVLFSSTAFLMYVALIAPPPLVPRSVLVLDAVFCFLILSGIRVWTRWIRETYAQQLKGTDEEGGNVLVVGAGAVGQTIAREIRQNPKLDKTVVGFLDNDPERQRQIFQGIPVIGFTRDLKKIARQYAVKQVIISQCAVSALDLRQIVEFCKAEKVDSKILPAMADIISGKVSIQHIRDIEIEDLLGRKPVQLDVEEIRRYLTGKRILVTGAGGSIGSEICRQVAAFAPGKVALFEQAETPLFQIERELKERFGHVELVPLLCDIRDRSRVDAVFRSFRPEVVFHAAAYKHVPLSEINPEEVVRNNVLGTCNVADAAHRYGAEHFVMISTDKAVNPTNIMGASKRAAEIYVQNLAQKSDTRIVTVRFGNVLGSNGSVVPIFREQIRKGGPVQVTHPEVTRFFMTISEAVQLVLQAGSMGRGGEIFLLDMGEPVKIVHLAEEMIRLSGLRPHVDLEIVFTGLRPGEKLYEELLLAGENVVPTKHQKIRVHHAAGYNPQLLQEQMSRLAASIKNMDRAAVEALIREMVPEYRTPPLPFPNTLAPAPVKVPLKPILIPSRVGGGGRD